MLSRSGTLPREPSFGLCDKAPPLAAVMLHLRARYVSKAAILGVPASIVPARNRSPI
jgi:hypothetical protein